MACRIVTLASLVIVVGVLVFISISDKHEDVGDIYDNIDKGKPWNEIASNLDPRMSDGQYDAMRTRYFYDIVAHKLPQNESTYAAYEYFMRRTDRTWRWDRHTSRGEPSRIVELVFILASMYLVMANAVWCWRAVLRPAGRVVRDEGLAGLANRILHGRKAMAPRS
jgi:hypothetical protein